MIPQRLKSPGRIRSAINTIQRVAAKTPSLVPESLSLSRLEVATVWVPMGRSEAGLVVGLSITIP